MKFYKYKEYCNLVKEGLIKTHNITNTIDILSSYLSKYKEDFSLYSELDNSYSNKKFSLYLDNYSNNILDNIITLVSNLGYYPSCFYYNRNLFKFTKENLKKFKLKPIKIVFDAKYDNEYIPNNYIIYHITSKNNVEKILNNGLCPKSKNKLSIHPERIYFLETIGECKNLINHFNSIEDFKNVTYVILKINIKIIKNDIEEIKYTFFEDPNSSGFYTYNNISPFDISLVS